MLFLNYKKARRLLWIALCTIKKSTINAETAVTKSAVWNRFFRIKEAISFKINLAQGKNPL